MNTIRTIWCGWDNKDQCKKEGKDIACVYKKGHKREFVWLEWGLSYCEDCYKTKECEEHFQRVWEEKWKQQEERAEANYEKYGVYTNMSGVIFPVSFYFGWTKTHIGFVPYESVYPNCKNSMIEKEIKSIMYDAKHMSFDEKKQKITDLINNSENKDDVKKEFLKSALGFIGILKYENDNKS